MYDKWKLSPIPCAVPEDMDALQSQIRGSDMTIAMMLTWNFMASEFNKQLEAIEEANNV